MTFVTPMQRLQQQNAEAPKRFAANTVAGKLLRRSGVANSPEMTRILELPRLDWQRDTDEQFVERVSEYLRALGGQQTLRKVQVATLQQLHDFGGALGAIRVGGGKTLISYLAPTVIGAQRPLLLTRASLVAKTKREFKAYAQHWRTPANIEIRSFEWLGRTPKEGSAEREPMDDQNLFLDTYCPDLLIADEAHRLRNLKPVVTRRVRRYIAAQFKAETPVKCVLLSGTMMKRSLRDFHHLAMWAMPQWCPLPMAWNELQDWADAVDEGIDDFSRKAPGALLHLADVMGVPPAEPLERARRGVQARLRSAPGIIMTTDKLDMSLELTRLKLEPDAITQEKLHTLRTLWETPNGDLLTEALEVWRHAREMVCGFCYRWDPAAPEMWLEARRQWNAWVRQTLNNNRRGLDSPLQVANAVDRGEYPEAVQLLANWRAIKHTFKPNNVADWYSNWMVEYAKNWLKNEPKGLVWVEHSDFGKALSGYAGVPFFSRGGNDIWGAGYIEDVPGAAVISIPANLEGRNLQYHWNKNLILSCPPTGALVEQLLGRTHREGQEEDTVYATFIEACEEQNRGIDRAVADARAIQDTTGQEQKMLYGDWAEAA